MDDKIQLQDLVDTLATAKGLSKKDATAFVRLLFDVISKAISTDKYVKIKGLGTFKQVMVESRESVNVNTGERFEIQGHSKISFTPDTSLKDLINRPFAHFETVVLNEDVMESDLEQVDKQFSSVEDQDIDETSSKMMGDYVEEDILSSTDVVLSEEDHASEHNLKSEPDDIDRNSQSESLLEKEPILECNNQTESMSEDVSETIQQQHSEEDGLLQETKSKKDDCYLVDIRPVLVKLVDPVNVQLEGAKAESEVQEELSNEQTKLKSQWRRVSTWLWGIVVLLLMTGSYFMGYFHILCPECSPAPVIVYDTVYVREKSPVIVKKDTVRRSADSLMAVSNKEKTEKQIKDQAVQPLKPKVEESEKSDIRVEKDSFSSYPQVKGGAYLIVGTMQKYTIRNGETIRLIAERFFGSRQMAPYIVKYNNIADPDRVAAGTVLKIPKLEPKRP